MAEKRKVANLMALAVLATVVQRPMHRYEMASLMRVRGKDRDMNIEWGSLYTDVQNLERSGYLEPIGVTRQGARPERTVYQITDAGRDELVTWTRELIAEPEAEHTRFVAGLSVVAVLTPDDVTDLLGSRLQRLTESIDALTVQLDEASDVPRLFLIEDEYRIAMKTPKHSHDARHASSMMTIMRKVAGTRANNKRESLDKILDAAARRIREEGIDGAAIVPVMRDAGLTHGAFYSHFSSKDDLASAAFGRAITTGRPHWIKPARGESWSERLTGLAKRYLTTAHRDDLSTSCGFATLSSDAAHASDQFRASYERELRTSLAAICGDDESDARLDDAIALMAVCVGGMALSRAVADPKFSTRILRVAREAATKLSANQPD